MFRRAAKNAAEAAADAALVTFGIEQTTKRCDMAILPLEAASELTKGVSRLIVSSKNPTSRPPKDTSKAAVVTADIGWNDVSFWMSLRGIGDKDANGNVIKGDALAIDTKSSFVSSDEALVTVLGVEDLVVVATMDAVLFLPPERTQDVKTVIDQIKAERRDESSLHLGDTTPGVSINPFTMAIVSRLSGSR